ncbi:MAG: hypothetical protein U1D36_07205 [Hydrogenophaga sp.]|uniref:hypothetical protein n=1 Tax=Hydrogenophaga sp. TaxID=1904254 RepID=UPI00273065DB|nr:hypothetical protein [Hydrogenophaga sp.]MDP2407789.1 hypothetical protein [Hydrogenophaga sp.]MDZ4174243.1 hypothetical protein [Hydrogenophaga sp.]
MIELANKAKPPAPEPLTPEQQKDAMTSEGAPPAGPKRPSEPPALVRPTWSLPQAALGTPVTRRR